MRRSVFERGALAAVLCALGCRAGGDDGRSGVIDPGPGASTPGAVDTPPGGGFVGDQGPGVGGAVSNMDGPLQVSAATGSITITHGAAVPTVQISVSFDGQSVPAVFRVLEGEFGSIDGNGVFTPSGELGGPVTIEASVGDRRATVTLIVRIERRENGATGPVAGGAGGIGGVGGEGLGPAIADAQVAALDGAPAGAPGLALLYPYNRTLFPLGLLSPLLMWDGGTQAYDAVRIRLYNDYYDYRGYFGRPALLAAASPFARHGIPEDVWTQATRSAQGGSINAEIVLLSGQSAVGPLTSTWQVARGRLRGTVYYQSYGTALVNQTTYTRPEGGSFGGATLAIRAGATAPEIVAGTDGGESACRVCHTVSADGRRMIAQHGDFYSASSSYDLENGNAESRPYADGLAAWIGMTADGALGLTNAPSLTSLDSTDLRWSEGQPSAQLVDLNSGAVIPTTGLSDFVTKTALPAFAHDSSKVVFNFYQGPGNAAIGPGDGFKLVSLDFDGQSAFSNPRLLWSGDATNADPAQQTRPGWPSFTPNGKAVVFNRNWGDVRFDGTINGTGVFTTWGDYWGKRHGDLWWVDTESGQASPLHAANGANPDGTSYLPVLPATNHTADESLNYEPSVSPIISGGYAWMVFVSRRLYGNVATIDPFRSNPRYAPLTQEITTKKLWVAAIDLNAPPGTDPSHPAFYLPGQELIGVNSRGFWVLDPCKPDGEACDGGDECCGGFCQAAGPGGSLICSNEPPSCSAEFDACETRLDCCDAALDCIGGRCSYVITIR